MESSKRTRLAISIGILLFLFTLASCDLEERYGDSRARFVHLSPDTPPLDVAFDNRFHKVFTNVSFLEATSYKEMASGTRVLKIRSRNRDKGFDFREDISLDGDENHSIFLFGSSGDLQVLVERDDLSAASRGAAKVRFLHAAPKISPVRVTAGGNSTFSRTVFGEITSYVNVPAKPVGVTFRVWTTSANAASVHVQPVILEANTLYTLALVGNTQGPGLRLVSIVDGSGFAGVPINAIETGAGGMATSFIPHRFPRDFPRDEKRIPVSGQWWSSRGAPCVLVEKNDQLLPVVPQTRSTFSTLDRSYCPGRRRSRFAGVDTVGQQN